MTSRFVILLLSGFLIASCGDEPALVINVVQPGDQDTTITICEEHALSCIVEAAPRGTRSVAIFLTKPLTHLVLEFLPTGQSCAEIDVPLHKQTITVDLSGQTLTASCLHDHSCTGPASCP